MTKMQVLNRILAVATILCGFFLAWTGMAETEFDNEFWISTSTNTSGLGTLDNPFDGSTATKFDTIMGSLPPNSTIHILAGTYQTDGARGWNIKSGQKILGSGMDVTILQLIPGAPSDDWVLADGSTGGLTDSNVRISDLTCDCNYQSGTYTYHGVGLGGTNQVVERVKVIHCAYCDPNVNSEAWGISIVSGYGNIIENCEVSQFAGGTGISAITISGGAGIIRDNRVLLSPGAGDSYLAFNGSGDNNILIEGNYVDGADVACYNDTGDNTNVVITQNTFRNCHLGICYVNNNIRKNFTISYNTIMLATNSPYGPGFGKWAFNLAGGCTNFNIIGNCIGWDGEPQPGELGYTYFLSARGAQGVLVAHNRIDARIGADLPYMPGNTNNYVAYDNYDFDGNLLTNVNQALPCTNSVYITPPDCVPQVYGAGSIRVGQFNIPGVSLYGWNCSSNLSATLFKPLPLPNEFWSGRTSFVTSWKLLTTNAGTYIFNIGDNYVLTNDVSGGLAQHTVAFTAPPGTNITTIAATNTIPTAYVDYFQTLIWTAYKVQPGNYTILSGKVTAQ